MDESKLKYQVLMDYIKKQISTGTIKPGEKIPSETELMGLFGMSRHTIRKAVQELQYDGYLYTEKGKGSFVSAIENRAKNGESGAGSKLIGILVAYINDTIFPPILHGIEEVVSQNGYSIFWGSTHNEVEREAEALMNMLKHDLAGLIVEPSKSALPTPNLYLYEQFEKRNIPVVFIHAYYSNYAQKSSYVIVDDVDAGAKAVRHLIEKGHKKIGGIFKADDIQGHKRHQGFIKGIQENGLEINECKVAWVDSGSGNDIYAVDILREKYQSRLQDCTAIVCYNDDVAISLTKALLQLGLKVPEDCSIIGFDNTRQGEIYKTPFTSLDHPKEKLGQLAAESLIRKIKNPSVQIQEEIVVELIEKKSVKTLPQPQFR